MFILATKKENIKIDESVSDKWSLRYKIIIRDKEGAHYRDIIILNFFADNNITIYNKNVQIYKEKQINVP